MNARQVGERNQLAVLRRRVRTALEDEPADLVLRRCRVISVHAEQIYPADIIISGGIIVGVRERFSGQLVQELHCDGLFAAPGLIEPYLFLSAPFSALEEVAEELVARGTTTAFAALAGDVQRPDAGLLLERINKLPCRMFYLASADTRSLPGTPEIAGLDAVAHGRELLLNPDYLYWISEGGARGKSIVSYYPGIGLDALNAIAAAGISADRGCESFDDLLARLRVGLTVFLVVSPGSHRISDILHRVIEQQLDTHHICFSVRHSSPIDLLQERAASLDWAVKLAIQEGIPPIRAVQMASLNVATYYGLDDQVGSIAPGRWADILLVRDPADFSPEVVIVGGTIVKKGSESIRARVTPHGPSARRSAE